MRRGSEQRMRGIRLRGSAVDESAADGRSGFGCPASRNDVFPPENARKIPSWRQKILRFLLEPEARLQGFGIFVHLRHDRRSILLRTERRRPSSVPRSPDDPFKSRSMIVNVFPRETRTSFRFAPLPTAARQRVGATRRRRTSHFKTSDLSKEGCDSVFSSASD